MSDRRASERRIVDLAAPNGLEQRQIQRRRGRPAVRDARRHRVRIACHKQELMKFQLVARLNHDLKISVMARDMVLDDVNAFLADQDRHELIAMLRAMGQTDDEITALLASL